ncbi:MBL fold metallo-hydrolase [Paenarthrobacter sp. CM16]|uniref:MBL fold metallo-hydrolase n=1 Tax=Paenarthrobacter sp. CM16 TaxID=2738447 RepID=UPI00155270C7|nr:MBL fold metallo-hydrolase [Paenarthrobacter sp. CM16]NQD88101.1 MBL fold metallo-hydrolase [Paenarthrobacter sp. CM16]
MDIEKHSPTTAPPIRATSFVGRWPDIPADWPEMISGKFSPTSATLISGPTEAILIDALYLKDDVRELGDLIERTGKSLTTIYITHAHADHYAGLGPLLERFPGARCVAMPHVVDAIKGGMEVHKEQWRMLFGDACVTIGPLPEPIDERTLFVDGSAVKIIEVKQADIHPTSIVHVPEIDVVVAGDSIYNEIHPMLGLATPEEWSDWLETVDLVESLNPRVIVAGHRRPDGDDHAVETMIAQTRSYIRDFAAAYEVAKDVEELVTVMVAKYPHHGNLWSLQFSAASALQYRESGKTAADAV